MNTLSILYDSLKPNLIPIVEILGFFLVTSIVGYVVYSAIFKIRSWWVLLPASGLLGIFSFIFFLGILSYLFKGQGGILIILILYVLFGFGLYIKTRPKIPAIYLNVSNLFWFITSLFFLALFFLIAGVNIYGGDVIAYWGFATSFANGNYPVMSPWQPDLLAAHHQGAFLYQGAVYSLIRVNMKLIHSLFAFFVISCGFFFLWGWMKEILKTTVGGLLIALMFYFAFSAIFIILPSPVQKIIYPEVTHEITTFPRFIDAKNRLGGSSNLNEIFYLNHRATALTGLILILFIVSTKLLISQKWKFPLLALFSMTIISADEVVLPSIGLVVLFYFIREFFYLDKEGRTKLLKNAMGSALLFVLLFFIIGSALRDAMLIPSDVPRFHLVFTMDSILSRLEEMLSVVLTIPNSSFFIYMPDLFTVSFLALIISLKQKNLVNYLILIAALGGLISFLLVEHTFYPGNQGRFLHLLYLLVVWSLMFGLIDLYKSLKQLPKAILGGGILLICGVSIVSSIVFLLKQVKTDSYPNYVYNLPEYQPIFTWMQLNAPQDRIFFIDGYLKGVSYSHLSLVGTQDYGLFVPISPAFIKVHTPDYGVEAFDIILALNPRDMAALKIKYLYIQNDQFPQITSARLSDLKNPRFFTKIYSDQFGTLYQVNQEYLSLGENDDSLSIYGLTQSIGSNKNVYLESTPGIQMVIRQVIWLALKAENTVYTNWGSGIFNYIETPIVRFPPSSEMKYDYVIVGNDTDPLSVCNCHNLTQIWQMSGAKAYRVID